MIVKSIWLRTIHKWVGLVVGIQFLLFAVSGAAMALIDMEEVAGGANAPHNDHVRMPQGTAWPMIRHAVAGQSIEALTTTSVAGRPVVKVSTSEGVRLFDATNGAPIVIDRAAVLAIAQHAHPDGQNPVRVAQMTAKTLAVRDHDLPIWQADFDDEKRSIYYLSGMDGAVLERRNDSWRWWDFFWMLHNMDYAERTSFNHPLIVTVAIAMAWLAVTGFWLLFRTMWRHDVAKIRSWARRTS